jgi:probable HAF family extracellular repeat protein
MKLNRLLWITMFVVFGVTAFPAVLLAQQVSTSATQSTHHSTYKLIDTGTSGGPVTLFFSPGFRVLNNGGTATGQSDTSAFDVFAPNISPFLNVDPFAPHGFTFRNGVRTDLGGLAPGLGAGPNWINDRGDVAGLAESGQIDPQVGIPAVVAVLWKDGQIVNLGGLAGGFSSNAEAINNRGQVAGAGLNGVPDPFSMVGVGIQLRAVLWENGTISDLGTLGGPDANAFLINDRGQIAGDSFISATPNPATGGLDQHVFLWEKGTMQDLGTLGGTFSGAAALNEAGQVVGGSTIAGDVANHPFLWDGGAMQDLGTLGGRSGAAFAMNQSGDVVGRADVPGSKSHHGFLWSNRVMTDLGTLSGQACSTARSVNARRQIVGDGGKCGVGGHGFLWENGSIVDLQNLIPVESGLRIIEGVWINDRGEIAANAVLPSGEFHAVLLIPNDDDTSSDALSSQDVTSTADSIDVPEVDGRGRMRAGHQPHP